MVLSSFECELQARLIQQDRERFIRLATRLSQAPARQQEGLFHGVAHKVSAALRVLLRRSHRSGAPVKTAH